MALTVDFLIVLVTFTREHHYVVRAGTGDQLGNGGAATSHKSDVGGVFETDTDVVENLARVFAARVIVGDEYAIGQALDNFGHQRALAAIAITAATEQAKQFAFGMWAQRFEDFFQGVRGVSVIDHHQRLLAAIGALLGLDYALDEILQVLPKLEGPAGRMQRLGGGSQPLVVVDYAHTPDALEKVLVALRPHAKGKLLCLFGCGGDRDRGKRPLMAEIVERLADGVLVTDDNPRSEDPLQIFDDIRAGFKDASKAEFVAGRGAAIAQLIASASADDVVVLAGKGHEDYQEINGERHAFSDLVEADHALTAWEVAHA